jgi:hypothetical protein
LTSSWACLLDASSSITACNCLQAALFAYKRALIGSDMPAGTAARSASWQIGPCTEQHASACSQQQVEQIFCYRLDDAQPRVLSRTLLHVIL